MLNRIKKSLVELERMKGIFKGANGAGITNIELLKGNLLDIMQPLLLEQEAKNIHIIIHNSTTDIVIDDIVIKSVLFEEEKINYRLEDRAELIETIEDFTKEATGNDLELMKGDIEYLNSLDDDFVFSSILTNKYVAFSDDADSFNSICKEILELNERLT